jgi:protein BCP1
MVNERLINAPPQLAPPLMQALFDEIAWAVEDEPTEEARQAFRLQRFVLITRAYTDPLANGGAGEGDGAGPSGSGAERKKKRKKTAEAVG